MPLSGGPKRTTHIVYAGDGAVVVAGDGGAFTCSQAHGCSLVAHVHVADSRCVGAASPGLQCFLAGDDGVYELSGAVDAPAVRPVSPAGARVVAAQAMATGGVAVAHGNATALTLHHLAAASHGGGGAQQAANLTRVYYVSVYSLEEARYNTSVGAMVGGNMTHLHFDAHGILWVGTDQCIDLLLPDLSFRRLDGVRGGLPYASITDMATTPQMAATTTDAAAASATWLSTPHGLLRYDYATRQFRCLCSGRFLRPSVNVTSVVAVGSGTAPAVLAANAGGGLGVIVEERQSLEAKAAELQRLVYPQVCGMQWGMCGDACSFLKHTALSSACILTPLFSFPVPLSLSTTATAWLPSVSWGSWATGRHTRRSVVTMTVSTRPSTLLHRPFALPSLA